VAQAFSGNDGLATAIVAFGANLDSIAGGPVESLEYAVDRLEMAGSGVDIAKISRFYRTPCFPAGAGPDYVNAAAVLRTGLTPGDLLSHLHRIEAELNRVRETRWAGRTLDLDLLAYGERVLPDPDTVQHWIDLPADRQREEAPGRLILPHPRIQDRPFVLVPLCEIIPDWTHPVTGISARDMLRACDPAELTEIKPV
jgi:2-amino-4-hydroxy-6-hydroxymethyldihydropteridine diphosphokinase